MALSLVLAVAFLAVALFWIIRSRRKEARHLDEIHITETNSNEKV